MQNITLEVSNVAATIPDQIKAAVGRYNAAETREAELRGKADALRAEARQLLEEAEEQAGFSETAWDEIVELSREFATDVIAAVTGDTIVNLSSLDFAKAAMS